MSKEKRNSSITFRTQISIVILCTAIIPLLILGSATWVISSRAMTSLVISRHHSQLFALNQGINQLVDQKISNLAVLCNNPVIESNDPAALIKLMNEFLTDYPFFSEAAVISASGQVVPSRTLNPLEKSDLYDLGRLQKTLNSFGIPEVRRTSRGELAFIYPIRLFAEFREHAPRYCVATGKLGSTDMHRALEHFPSGTDGYACIISAEGTILARQGEVLSNKATSFNISQDFFRKLRKEMNTVTVQAEHPGRSDILSLSYNEKLDVYLGVGIDRTRAFSLLYSFRSNLLICLFVALTLSLAGAFFLGRSLSMVIEDLTDGLSKISSGGYTHVIPPGEYADLNRAIEAANDLGETLQRNLVISDEWKEIHLDQTED